jgi:hypothetical protein
MTTALPRTPAPAPPPAAGDPPRPERHPRSWAALLAGLTARALVNPRLAADLLRTAWAFRRRGWQARPPFLPLPDRTYLRWRMYTAYGDEEAIPPVEHVVRFARWRRETMGF